MIRPGWKSQRNPVLSWPDVNSFVIIHDDGNIGWFWLHIRTPCRSGVNSFVYTSPYHNFSRTLYLSACGLCGGQPGIMTK